MMQYCTFSGLVAQANIYEQMGRRFRPGGNSFGLTDAVIWLLFIAGAVALVWFLHKIVTQLSQAKKHSLNGLFGQLCIAHGIGWQDRRLLFRLAGVHGLAHPTHLFVRPDCFRPQSLPPEMAAFQGEIAGLQTMLFGNQDGAAVTGRS